MKNQQKLKPGQGEVVCEIPLSSKIRPVFSTLHASYPLKFLSPRTHSPSLAALYILTYGGGLVSGDSVSVKIDCKEGVNLLLLTQASTGNNTLGTITNDFEFYISASPDLNQKESPTFLTKLTTTQQSLHARIHQNSLLLQLPEPTTCFRSAEFKQRQRQNA
ncbi:hypothetical protein G9A89_018168 [Geosiphon pyriformis]|nr:hypothetical protein G9A89_015478 [Geosiphon pyriformis]KAG9306285.1 hypothetical protein G9A89_018168 [Geosiphon pyriformis]